MKFFRLRVPEIAIFLTISNDFDNCMQITSNFHIILTKIIVFLREINIFWILVPRGGFSGEKFLPGSCGEINFLNFFMKLYNFHQGKLICRREINIL